MDQIQATRDLLRLEAKNAQAGVLPPNTNFDSYVGHSVINISKVQLSTAQTRALEKGLTFCPTPGAPDKSQIWLDFKEFQRRLELTHHFFDNNPVNNNDLDIDQEIIDFMNENAGTQEEETINKQINSQFKHKSNWRPNPPNKTLDNFQRAFKNDLLKQKIQKPKSNNLTKQERMGLAELSKNPEIVIKKADKGSAVVVMNTTDYLREGYRQLSDPNFYQRLKEDPTQKFSAKIAETLTQMRQLNLITEKNFDFLNKDNSSEGLFYLLPKIHKKGVPGRPICSSCNHPTANISKFVDEHIKRYVPKTMSYVRDTQHFIKRIKELGPLPENSLLVTLDVSSLYTNIPNHEGIQAVADHIRRDPDKRTIGPFIIRLLKLVLHSMNFEFNGDHYLQIGGTAMGTALAPNYANLFMDRFETKALAGWHKKPKVWLRFIDDIFMIWEHGLESLNEFIEYLNNIHPTIKFTSEYSNEKIAFLDTTVKIDDDLTLYTTLYEKPTDTHLYLHYTSSHHTPCKTKGPYGQYLRLRRICTKDIDFETNAKKLTGYYLKRDYPHKMLKQHYQRAKKFSQNELLEIKPKETNTTPVMVTNYNPQNPKIRNMINQNWNIISNSNDCGTLFPQRPIVGFRRLPNLREMLTKAKIRYPQPVQTQNKPTPKVCTRLGRCTYCPKIKKLQTVKCNYSGNEIPTKNLPKFITCELNNIIYIIHCTKCNMDYVGETGREFRKRIYEHRLSVMKPKDNRNTPVSRHFTTEGHNHTHMQFSVLEWCTPRFESDCTGKRRRVEMYWIFKLHSLTPLGINQFV